MSTLFTSAAMGLLSRTIQALLSKYLSDVDVEGVEVPSFTDSSGWGVRLSNVRLREGTQLLVLPGKMRGTAPEAAAAGKEETKNTPPPGDGLTQRDSELSSKETDIGESEKRKQNGQAGISASPEPQPKRSSWFSWSRSNVTDNYIIDESEQLLDGELSEATRSQSTQEPVPCKIAEDTSMVLKLGSAGKIGVLDVRLAGKSIHVLIEDAELTLEVTELPVAKTEDATKDDRPDVAKPEAAKSPPPEESVGDRVLAENIVAKVLAAIPNLFLRDISLRVMLPDSRGGEVPTCVEVNIDFLSVTDGADFLANFGPTRGGEADDRSQSPSTASEASNDSVASEEDSTAKQSETENEFLTKRLRTGKGSHGGIVVRVLTGREEIPSCEEAGLAWARERWYQDTGFVLLRCSGLELLARIFLGSKAEQAKRRADPVDYEEIDLDTLLFGGCDYVAPGPLDPAPPKAPDEPLIDGPEEIWMPTNGASKLFKQKNGVQLCDIPSHFHKVGRGFKPCHCPRDHHPSVQCCSCWKSSKYSNSEHRLDNCSPLGGLVCHLSISEPLEINIDRFGFETIAALIGFFSKPKTEHRQDQSVGRPQPSRSRLSMKPNPRKLQRNQNSLRESFDGSRRSVATNLEVSQCTTDEGISDDIEEMIPSYMQPEKICFAGLYIAAIRLRIHALENQKTKQAENGTSFRYWDVHMEHIAMDHHFLAAKERPFQDMQLGFGYAKLLEYKGVQAINIASVGRQLRSIRDVGSRSSEVLDKDQRLRCWPSTAATMLDIPLPLGPVDCDAVLDQGIQLRLCSVTDGSVRSRNLVAHVSSPWVKTALSIKDDIMTVVSEAIGMFRSPSAVTKPKTRTHTSVLRYKVSTDGGCVGLFPLIDARFPPLSVYGELSTEAGFSLNAALSGISIKVGKSAPLKVPEDGLSLKQLARLPETVRLRILLFLKDLTPFQAALGLPVSQNSFLACRAVNNGIVEAANRIARSTNPPLHDDSHQSPAASREEMVRQLMSLDSNALSLLLEMHRNLQK